MATLYIRNVPIDVVAELKRRAKAQGRSVNAEVVALLTESLPQRRSTEDVLRDIQELAATIDLPADWDPVEDIRRGREERMRRVLGD